MQSQTRRIPLTVALVAFVWYVCTMGAGVTVHSLPLAAKLAGWDASPLVGQPLVWLLTLPLKLLPAGWVPLAVKLLAAARCCLGTIPGKAPVHGRRHCQS